MRLSLVELRVADLDRSLNWYRNTLGLVVTIRDQEGLYALLEAGPVHLALKQDPARTGRDAVRLTFQVENLDAERGRLIERGVVVDPIIENRRENYREARLIDPDGTPISLFEWLDHAINVGRT